MNFTWSGQSCGSTSRVFLHESIHDQVLEKVVKLLPERHKPGIPTDPKTTMGSLVSRAQLEKVQGYVAKGLEDGGRLVVRRQAAHGRGARKTASSTKPPCSPT